MTAKKIIERRRRARARRKMGYKIPSEQDMANAGFVYVTDPIKYGNGTRFAGELAFKRSLKKEEL